MEPQLDIHEALKALAHPGRLDFLKWLKHPEHYFGLASADVQGGEVADKINKLDKHIGESLQQSLDTINKNAAEDEDFPVLRGLPLVDEIVGDRFTGREWERHRVRPA